MFTKNTCTKWKNCAWVQPRRQRLPRPLPRERKRPIRKDFLASAGYFLKGSCPAIVNPVCKVMSDSNSSHHWLLVAFKQRKEKKTKKNLNFYISTNYVIKISLNFTIFRKRRRKLLLLLHAILFQLQILR